MKIIETEKYLNFIRNVAGECDVCGTKVYLSHFTNTCEKCGADYNMSGQRLAPRSQWGEETGESVEDILSYNNMSPEELLDNDEDY